MQEKHLHHARDWEHPDVQHYETTIAAKIPGYPLLYDIMEQLLSAHLGGETPADLLIVGAGGGQELITLGAQHEHWRLTGIDLSTAMLELARQRMQRTELAAEITLQQSTVDELDKNKLFDAATCMLVLHFSRKPDRSSGCWKKSIAGFRRGDTGCGNLKRGRPFYPRVLAAEGMEKPHAGWRDFRAGMRMVRAFHR